LGEQTATPHERHRMSLTGFSLVFIGLWRILLARHGVLP
jgi:hypothetical protein